VTKMRSNFFNFTLVIFQIGKIDLSFTNFFSFLIRILVKI
jgi:hypothetical protein